ncbi:MAG TPA: type II toxin-antitoxin system Phd/YefM family antitoxin [Longimicrobiaceae bacterium]|nr:type II toxin-antitoxin system Phd/YefM family antitoxin [Longimicrobiaceae bacterium]
MADYKPPKDQGLQYVREAAARFMTPPAEWVSAGDFKTRCLQLIEQVRQERTEVVVTRYGKPVARLVPYEGAPVSAVGHLAGTVLSYGDLVSPVGEDWEADA